jgi:resuscitation-promoting factor RpfB
VWYNLEVILMKNSELIKKQPPKNAARTWVKKHRLGLSLISSFFIVLVAMTVYVSLNAKTEGASDTRVALLTINGSERAVPTRAQNVKELLQKVNITLAEKDLVIPSLDTPIKEDSMRVEVVRARNVTIIDGVNRTEIITPLKTPRDILEEAKIAVFPEDTMTIGVAQSALLERTIGERLIIDRAPVVSVNLYGQNVQLRSRKTLVADILKEHNVTPAPDDRIDPALDTQILGTKTITINRFGKTTKNEEQPIAFTVEKYNDAESLVGTNAVTQRGLAGKKIVTYEIDLQNDKEIARRVIQETQVVPPVNERQSIGTKTPPPKAVAPVVPATPSTPISNGSHTELMAAAGIAASDYGYVEFIMSRESGWRPGAVNPGGCIGLGQSCPGGSGLARDCPNWRNDPVCQLAHFSRYAGRYGGWAGSYSFWIGHNWW